MQNFAKEFAWLEHKMQKLHHELNLLCGSQQISILNKTLGFWWEDYMLENFVDGIFMFKEDYRRRI